VTVELVAVTYDAEDPIRVAAFWGALLDREVRTDDRGALAPGGDAQVGLHFVRASSRKDGPDRVHLHLTSPAPGDQPRTVAEALRLGARHLDVGQSPDEGHVVLADPEGNELCVIEAGNAFLDGCGPLGELACDGTREVGVFWHHALGWPLVWDQDGETSVQSPRGGTKVSWGGPPVAPKRGRNRQRFDLTATDVDADVAHLVALGATGVRRHEAGTELLDPDGNEFAVTAR
jgi:hypothetical protein